MKNPKDNSENSSLTCFFIYKSPKATAEYYFLNGFLQKKIRGCFIPFNFYEIVFKTEVHIITQR